MGARVGVTKSHREPERDSERVSKSQREPVRARGNQSELETTRKSHNEPRRAHKLQQ